MSAPTAITTVDDAYLCQIIGSVERRLVFMTPGMSDQVAEAVCNKWLELPSEAVNIIVDVDPEVCRMGFGTIGALKKLNDQAKKVDSAIHEQAGVRIALLIADDVTLFYAPTPLLIETGSDTQVRPNAVKLNLVPTDIAKDMGLTETGGVAAVGTNSISPQKILETTNDLVRNPPMKFDIARKVRVFNSQIEFVEFELRGHQIGKRKVNIPSDLLGLAKDDKTKKLLHSSFQLIDDEDAKISGKEITDEKEKIARDFLINLPNFGNVILRSKKEEFETAVETLRKQIEAFQKELEAKLQQAIDKNRASLVNALAPAVIAQTPDRWQKFLPTNPSEDDIRQVLDCELAEQFGSAEANLKKIDISLIFKGVTYETLNDPEFVKIVKKKMPILRLYEEYDAAKEAQQRLF
ncbi:MAG: hypothetical protein HYS23_01255 [Geobacter sp.]|nr:hypothetical protein [Geobacter sp.]